MYLYWIAKDGVSPVALYICTKLNLKLTAFHYRTDREAISVEPNRRSFASLPIYGWLISFQG